MVYSSVFPRFRKRFHSFPSLALLGTALAARGLQAPGPAPVPAPLPPVVINEIMYHPPDDRDDLQWVELRNTGAAPVALRGWELRQGVRFTFTNATELVAGGTLVIARDLGAFVTHYGTNIPVLGEFRGRLKHGRERLELVDASGRVIDTVAYADRAPWPTSPDGAGASLERLSARGAGDDAGNWAPSLLPRLQRAGGSPGQTNAATFENLPPVISAVTVAPITVGQPTVVTFEAADPDGVQDAGLSYQFLSAGAGTERGTTRPENVELAANRIQGDARQGRYQAKIPAAPAGQLVRFSLRATDSLGGRRLAPHPADGHPTWTYYSGTNTNDARVPFAFLLPFGAKESAGASLRNPRGRNRNTGSANEPSRGESALVYLPPGGGPIQVFDHVRITPRQGGWKVRLQKDQAVDGMRTVNVLFEFQPRYVLSEFLSYELYRAAGVPAPLSGHWRVWMDGRPLGYYLTVEQPNGAFLERNQLDAGGSLFKLLWYGNGLIGQHEKKNHPETGHNDLVRIVNELGATQGAAQWRLIEQNFHVEECARYYAVNMCLQNWDGFFNNYFAYRSPGPAGKWQILPWDEDKTWGDYDGASPRYDWYTMPLNFGAAGDMPNHGLSGRFGGGPWGGAAWWRPPGWFSGPLLANPTFRARFRTVLHDLCVNQFTPEKFGPVLDKLAADLEPEVRYRATLSRGGGSGRPAAANSSATEAAVAAQVQQFRDHVEGFRQQVVKRREFILAELAKDK